MIRICWSHHIIDMLTHYRMMQGSNYNIRFGGEALKTILFTQYIHEGTITIIDRSHKFIFRTLTFIMFQ